ncbi:hypothetical protein [Aquisphaera insulae]|uniref:hypothetical protein n=1 Tax=Aquisphaera insulae TaxID=2712864 RepID=UPI0013EAE437|nr:hypothetical protein [Aquisphaera insulae]
MRHLMAFIAFAAVGLCLDSCAGAIWDGAFPLQVDLVGSGGHSIVAVAARSFASKDEIEHELAHPDCPESRLEEIRWGADQSFEVRVRCSGTKSMMSRRELSYFQHRFLLVRVEYADGARRVLSLAIPDGRVTRHLTAQIR